MVCLRMVRCVVCCCFEWYGDHRDLHVLTHSFPTRRSSDLDGGWTAAFADAADAIAPLPAIDPFAPAAIMYTSGTTGVPKGVVHSQHNMIVIPAAAFAQDRKSVV